MGARQYAPGLGRFLEVDPVEGGSANDYDYVGGDPVNAVDLDGLCSKHKGIGGWLRDRGCDAGNGTKVVVRAVKKAVKKAIHSCDGICMFASWASLAMGAVVTAGICAATALVGCIAAGVAVGAGVAAVHHVTATHSRRGLACAAATGAAGGAVTGGTGGGGAIAKYGGKGVSKLIGKMPC